MSHLTNRDFSTNIRINTVNGKMIAGIWGDMPTNIRASLEHNIRSALLVGSGPALQSLDSSKTPGGHKFPAFHFDYYVRYATRVSMLFFMFRKNLILLSRVIMPLTIFILIICISKTD